MNPFDIPAADIPLSVIFLNLILSFTLQMCIVWVYRKTHKGLSYSPSFLFTLVVIGTVGTMIMMIVQRNIIGAFALLGAFSLIRFRTIVKETRDIAFVFLALTAGVAVGTGSYEVAIVGSSLIILIIGLLHRYDFGSKLENSGFILTFNSNTSINQSTLEKIFDNEVTSYELLQTKNFNDIYHFVYSLKLKSSLGAQSLVAKLKEHPEIENPELITGKHTIEY